MPSPSDSWRGVTIPLAPGQVDALASSADPRLAPAATPAAAMATDGRSRAPDPDAPRLGQAAIGTRLPAAVASLVGANGAALRGELQSLLGQGTSGRVYALQDHNLGRLVAIKCLQHGDVEDPQAVARIIDEARLTASLSHPNVLPIYDLDLDERGCAYFTMKHIEGRSLGSIIEGSTRDRRDARLASPAAAVSIFIGVAQALAYAHRQGVIHQDIKPDNIMVGSFGEVLVVDWGCAVRLGDAGPGQLYGTPLYMSPEQAAARASDRRSDVYCIAASLFHALLLRPPTWAESSEEFWRLKRAGVVQPPTREERRTLPAALASILARALDADPARRYQDAGELLADLCAWRDGERVGAHRESARERFARWHRRHGRRSWLMLAAASSALALALLLFGERLEEYASWGGPSVVEEFADDHWRERWTPGLGGFRRDGDALVSDRMGFNTIWLDRICPGATAIEYDAAVGATVWSGDIGAVWCSDARPAPDGRGLETPTVYAFKFGCFSGGFTLLARYHIARDGTTSGEEPLAYSPQTLLKGRSYHVRAQVADDRLDLWVDGVLVCSWRDPFAFASGRIGLMAYDDGKAYRHVQVYIRGVAQKVPAIAVGDALVQEGDFPGAEREYARIAASFPGSALEREALYREGVCAYRQGALEEARALWRPLAGTDHEPQVRLQEVDALVAAHRIAAALEAMRALAPSLDQQQLLQLAIEWNALAVAVEHRQETSSYAPCLALHDRIFSDEPAVDYECCRLLLLCHRYDDILARYPQQRFCCAQALLLSNRFEEVVQQYPDQPIAYTMATFNSGQFELMPERLFPGLRWTVRLVHGDYDTLINSPSAPPALRAKALLRMGRLEEAFAMADTKDEELQESQHAVVAFALGRPDAVRASSPALYAYLLGDPAQVSALAPQDTALCAKASEALAWRRCDPQDRLAFVRACADQKDHEDDDVRFEHALLAPFLLERADQVPRLDAAIAYVREHARYLHMQALWFDASYLAGAVDAAAFRAQPCCGYADARLLLLDAMRAERGGDRAGALAHYRAWSALPFWKRHNLPQPTLAGLIDWHIAQLAAQLASAP